MFPTRIFRSKDPLSEVTHEIDRLFESLVPDSMPFLRRLELPRRAFPALNVWEDGDNVYAEAELPGFAIDDLELSATHNLLTIKGKREVQYDDNVTVLRSERASGEFERTIELPQDVETEKVEASLTNGILRITMPKASAARKRQIKISCD